MELVSIVASIGLLAGNFFFVAVEFAVTRARPSMVTELVEQGASGANSLKHAVDNIDNYLSACQLGITISSIGLGITAEPLVKEALTGLVPGLPPLGLGSTAIAFALAYFVVSMFHVVLGELAPKSLAIARTRSTGLILLPPMRIFYLATKPVVDFFNFLGNLVLKPFGIPPASEASGETHSEDELRRLIAKSEREGVLDPHEQRFAEGVFTFGDRRAREIMVPRTAVAYADAALSAAEVARRMLDAGHTRLPVCEDDGDLDATTSFVHVMDVVAALSADDEPTAGELGRPLLRVPEAILLDELLGTLREERQHVALVEDEHGTVTGLVTLEDVLEEIVGDIRDEFDPRSHRPVRKEGERLVVEGSTPVRQVAEELDLELDGREATIGGFVVELLGRLPRAGETLELGGRDVEIAAVEGSRVTQVKIGPPSSEEGDAS